MGLLAVAHRATSAAVVRHSIADDLHKHQVAPDSIDDVVLVASELVGNAVTHAAATFDDSLDVRWDMEGDAVVVRVVDGTPEQPPELRAGQPEDTSGRGLAIVAALAQDWGVRSSPAGKEVWARVPINRNGGQPGQQSAGQPAEHS